MATISTTEYLLDQAKRRLTPSINNFPGMAAVEQRLLNTNWTPRKLADPPPGSGLKPVMGDRGLPVVGHLIEMMRGGPDYLLFLYETKGPVIFGDSPVLPGVAALGPDAAQVDLLQPQQGLLPAGLGAGDRPVLQPWPDAARLRGAHVPSADHAGSVRPLPAGRLCRADGPGRLAGSGQRLGRQRSTFSALPGDERAHPRHRVDGVHGSRTRHRPSSW